MSCLTSGTHRFGHLEHLAIGIFGKMNELIRFTRRLSSGSLCKEEELLVLRLAYRLLPLIQSQMFFNEAFFARL